jgi:hypothetical protein
MPPDRPQRPVRRIAEVHEIGGVAICREPEDAARLVLVGDRRMSGADAEVGGGAL